MPNFSPDELIGKVFMFPQEISPTDAPMRAEVVRKSIHMDAKNHQRIK